MAPKIIVAEDHLMTAKGVRLVLEFDFAFRDVSCVTSCSQLMESLRKVKYTHMIVDIGLSDGSVLEILPNIRKMYPEIKIMVFSARPADIYEKVLRIYKIVHFLPKTAAEEEMIFILRQFFDDTSTQVFEIKRPHNPFSTLAPRQQEVLYYLLKGKGINEISQTLNLKKNTISTVKARIFEKCEVRTLKELLELAALYKADI